MVRRRQYGWRILARAIAFVFFIPLSIRSLLAQPQSIDWSRAQDEAVTVLQNLIRRNTSNPPGNEIRAANYLKKIFDEAGIASSVYELAPGRGNIIARLKSDGKKKPLLLPGDSGIGALRIPLT